MSEAGCDTTTSDMLIFVCSAVCSHSQFGRKPTIILFLKLVLAGGRLFTQHVHYPEQVRSESATNETPLSIVYYEKHFNILRTHWLKPTFLYIFLNGIHISKWPLYPQDEHLHRFRRTLSSHTTPELCHSNLHAIHLSILTHALKSCDSVFFMSPGF